MSTRTKLFAGGAALAVFVVLVVAYVWFAGGELPIRKGMSRSQARATPGWKHHGTVDGGERFRYGPWLYTTHADDFRTEPDWLGNTNEVRVFYVNDEVAAWEVAPGPREAPPWLTSLRTRFGW
jgi:hypothetical protein